MAFWVNKNIQPLKIMKTHLLVMAATINLMVGCCCLKPHHSQIIPSRAVTAEDFFPVFGCQLAGVRTSASFTTNILQNGSLSGSLTSVTINPAPGNHDYGYGYQLVLNHLTGAGGVEIDSMKLNFKGSGNQAWVITSHGTGNCDGGGLGIGSGEGITGPTSPGAVTVSGSTVTFNFTPPLAFSSGGPAARTYFFFLTSSDPLPPPSTANAFATFKGSVDSVPNTLNYLFLPVRTPP